MKTIKSDSIKWKNEDLEHAYNTAVKAGFKVLVSYWEPKKIQGYFTYSDGQNVAYIQAGDYGHGVTISTVHKGNRNTGTGYGLDNWDEPRHEVTAEDLKEGFIFCPNWASRKDRPYIVKYANLEDYFKNAIHQDKYFEVK